MGDGSAIGTLPKAARILEFFARNGTDWRIRDVSQELGISRSSVHRICQALVDEELLSYDPVSERYSWGTTLIRIAHAVYFTTDWSHLARSVLEGIVAKTGETAIFVSYDYDRHEIVFAMQEETTRPLRYHYEMGKPMPAYAGASGKSIMAFLPSEEIEAIISQGLDPLTEQTITDPDKLRESLAEIREQGYAVSHGERTFDAVGHGCPVFDREGGVFGGLCVTVPEYRHSADVEAQIVETLREGAQELSSLMGFWSGALRNDVLESKAV